MVSSIEGPGPPNAHARKKGGAAMVEEFASRARNRLSSSDERDAPFHFETTETPIKEPWSAPLNKVKAKISESHRNTKGVRSGQDRTSGKLTVRITAGIRRRAQSTTWWIYHEIGDAEARKLL